MNNLDSKWYSSIREKGIERSNETIKSAEYLSSQQTLLTMGASSILADFYKDFYRDFEFIKKTKFGVIVPHPDFNIPGKDRNVEEKMVFDNYEKVDAINNNPNLLYPRLDNIEKLSKIKKELLKLQKKIAASENNNDIKEIYGEYISKRLSSVNMISASAHMQKSLTEDEKTKYRNDFMLYQDKIYEEPKEKIFNLGLTCLLTEINQILSSSSDPKLLLSANNLKKHLPIPENNVIALKDFNEFKKDLRKYTLSKVDIDKFFINEDSYSSSDLESVFNNILNEFKKNETYGIDNRWNARIDDKASLISVEPLDYCIKIPKKNKYSSDRARQLALHELFVHVIRNNNGEKSKLQLLGMGLPDYTKGEEGLACMMELMTMEEIDLSRYLDRHLAISFACGMDSRKRNYGQVYEIMRKYYDFKLRLEENNNPKVNKKTIEERAHIKTKNLLFRTFRGTDCKTPGVCFRKDIAYFEGLVEMYIMLSKKPELFDVFLRGKFDPANKKHIDWLHNLKIIDDREYGDVLAAQNHLDQIING